MDGAGGYSRGRGSVAPAALAILESLIASDIT